MGNMFDDRLLRVTITVGGITKTYDSLAIEVSGTKSCGGIVNECTIKVYNLDKKIRDKILSETSPYLMHISNATIVVEAGRKSYGYSQIYRGHLFRSSITQPPDICLTMKCMTGFANASVLNPIGMGATATLSQTAQKIASNYGVPLSFEATDKNLSNYHDTKSVLHQPDTLAKTGGVDSYIDDDVMIVKDKTKPRKGKHFFISEATGMIGIPEMDVMGVKVKCLFNPALVIGGGITVQSNLNPTCNGSYIIYKIDFDLANRNTQFYYTLQTRRAVFG